MKLTDQLRQLADANPDLSPLLFDAIDRIELAHQWRAACLESEHRIHLLTLRIELLEFDRDTIYRKEKADHEENCND